MLLRRLVRYLRRQPRVVWHKIKRRGAYRPGLYQRDSALPQTPAISDISDHLPALQFFSACKNPTLIVELGTRAGESTRVLLNVAAESKGYLLSVDKNQCDIGEHPHKDRWTFRQSDDIEFANKSFVDWCSGKGLAPIIDVLFIDTSHELTHTLNELNAWSPFLASEGVMLLHDTHMGKGTYSRLDGSVGIAWNNDRGVIAAVETWLNAEFDESLMFSASTNGWNLFHLPFCNGLLVLQKDSQN